MKAYFKGHVVLSFKFVVLGHIRHVLGKSRKLEQVGLVFVHSVKVEINDEIL